MPASFSPSPCADHRPAVITLIAFATASDALKLRSPFILVGLLMCLVGFSINISHAAIGVKYFGTFFIVSGSYAAIAGLVTWCVALYIDTACFVQC